MSSSGGGGQVGAGSQCEGRSGGNLLQVQRAQGFGRVQADQRWDDVEDVGGAAQPDTSGLAVLDGLVVVVAAHGNGSSLMGGSGSVLWLPRPFFSLLGDRLTARHEAAGGNPGTRHGVSG